MADEMAALPVSQFMNSAIALLDEAGMEMMSGVRDHQPFLPTQ